jgi:PKD repeat protein
VDYTLAPVTVAQNGPVVTMTKPAAAARYRAGVALALEGSATDPQDGTLSGGALTWTVTRKTATSSTVVATPTGAATSFTPPTNHDADVWYEVQLSATDSDGTKISAPARRVDPDTVDLTLASSPAGASLKYASSAAPAPFTKQALIGWRPAVEAPQSYTSGGILHTWERWSDGGAWQHQVTVPAAASTLTAYYNRQPRATPGAAATGGPYEARFDAQATDADSDPLTYAWDFGDATTGAGATPTHAYAAAGTYTATVTVSDGRSGGTKAFTAPPVTVAQNGPTVSMSKPAAGAKYRGGQLLQLEGSASDAQDGTLPGSSLTWQVSRSSDAAVIGTATGATATVELPSNHDGGFDYRVKLTARDSDGTAATTSRTLAPDIARLTLASSPAGAPLTYSTAGAVAAPFTVDALIGWRPQLSAPARWSKSGVGYRLVRWSDGDTRASRPYTMPATAATLTAEYAVDAAPTATIESPAAGARFDAGQRIELRGSGHDAEGPTTDVWTVTCHRGGTAAAVPLDSGGFTVPLDAAVDDWYDIVLTATDSQGGTGRDTRRLDPRTSTVSLDSDPAGAELGWNGGRVTAPSSALAVVGSEATASAPAAFDRGGRRWLFDSWSNGGGREQGLRVPASDLALLARFSLQPLPPPGPAPAPDQQQPPAPGPLPGPGPTPPAAEPEWHPLVELLLSSRGMRASRAGTVQVKLRNRNATAAIGALELATAAPVRAGGGKARHVRLATGAFIVAPNATRTITVQISKANLKLLRSLRRIRVTVVWDGHDRGARRESGRAETVLLSP